MASKSKFLPFVAVAVALIFLWCYPPPSSASADSGASDLGPTSLESTRIEAPLTGTGNSPCEACQSVVKKSVKSELPAAGHIGTPVNLSSDAFVEPLVLLPPTADTTFSKRFALHRSSLFNQAILIRI